MIWNLQSINDTCILVLMLAMVLLPSPTCSVCRCFLKSTQMSYSDCFYRWLLLWVLISGALSVDAQIWESCLSGTDKVKKIYCVCCEEVISLRPLFKRLLILVLRLICSWDDLLLDTVRFQSSVKRPFCDLRPFFAWLSEPELRYIIDILTLSCHCLHCLIIHTRLTPILKTSLCRSIGHRAPWRKRLEPAVPRLGPVKG